MFAGSTRWAAGFLLTVGGIGHAQSFEYAAGTGTYRVIQSTKAAQEAMGQKQEIESESNQVMTVTLTRSAKDTVTMNIVLDSISSSNSMGMPSNLDRFLGMKVAAKLSPVGAFYSVRAEDNAPADAEAISHAMGNFLPRLRGTLARGTSWADTSSGTMNQGGMQVERKTISTYRVEGDTTIRGERSWKIVRVDSTSMTGSGNTANGPMTMEGTSKGTGALFVTPKGVFLGGEGSEEAVLRVVVAANAMEIGITQSAITKVQKIR